MSESTSKSMYDLVKEKSAESSRKNLADCEQTPSRRYLLICEKRRRALEDQNDGDNGKPRKKVREDGVEGRAKFNDLGEESNVEGGNLHTAAASSSSSASIPPEEVGTVPTALFSASDQDWQEQHASMTVSDERCASVLRPQALYPQHVHMQQCAVQLELTRQALSQIAQTNYAVSLMQVQVMQRLCELQQQLFTQQSLCVPETSANIAQPQHPANVQLPAYDAAIDADASWHNANQQQPSLVHAQLQTVQQCLPQESTEMGSSPFPTSTTLPLFNDQSSDHNGACMQMCLGAPSRQENTATAQQLSDTNVTLLQNDPLLKGGQYSSGMAENPIDSICLTSLLADGSSPLIAQINDPALQSIALLHDGVTEATHQNEPSRGYVLERAVQADVSTATTRRRAEYPTIWSGAIGFESSVALIQMHKVGGNSEMLNSSVKQFVTMINNIALLRIAYCINWDTSQLQNVQRKMNCEDEFVALLVFPCGPDVTAIRREVRILHEHFIERLQSTNAIGVCIADAEQQQSSRCPVMLVFPPCEFSTACLEKYCPDLYEACQEISANYLFVVLIRAN